jgi:hypothetical protein
MSWTGTVAAAGRTAVPRAGAAVAASTSAGQSGRGSWPQHTTIVDAGESGDRRKWAAGNLYAS